MRFARLRKSVAAVAASVATLAMGAAVVTPVAQAADDTQYPDVMLGAFWNADNDYDDTVYMSVDGVNFKRLSIAYDAEGAGTHVSGKPDYVNALHDPGISYANGTFWMSGGFAQVQEGLGCRFTPMLGSSKDLKTWSYPNSGSPTNLVPAQAPDTGGRTLSPCSYDSAGSEMFIDDNGDAYVVTTLGYFAMNHRDSSQNDVMHPYIVKVSGLAAGADQAADPGAQPQLTYGSLDLINLPQQSNNWLDPSLYKENGTYYLSIKKNGVINQIYASSDPMSNNWRLVSDNVLTGYEGPSLTKFNGRYYMFADGLKDYPGVMSTGVVSVSSTSLNATNWGGKQRINTVAPNGAKIPNRHGSVITVTDPAAKKVIWDLYDSQYGSRPVVYPFTDVNDSTPHAADILWIYQQGISTGWIENGQREYRPDTDVSRQDYAAFLYRLAGNPSFDPAASTKHFSDVNPSTAHYQAIMWAASTGVINGYSDGSFRGESSIARQDAMQMLYRLAGSPSVDSNDNFTDASSTGFVDALAWAKTTKISNGYGDGSFGVGQTIIRQDMAAFLKRAAGVLSK